MVIQVTNYVFAPGGAGVGTITFSGYVSIELKNVILITNVTDGEIIYNFRIPGNTGTVAGNVLTLMESTAAMSAGDELQIIYNDPTLTHDTSTLATQTTLDLVRVAVQALAAIVTGGTLDISGAVTVTSGAITETNSAAIKSAVEILAAIVTGGTLDISGTVTANAGTDLNTSLLSLESTQQSVLTSLQLLDNTVAGSELQVDVVTDPPLLAATDSVLIYGTNDGGTTKIPIKTDATGEIQVDISSSTLALEATLQSVKTAVEVLAAIVTGGTLDISGTVTADAGTNLNTSALALEATMQSILTGITAIQTAVQIMDDWDESDRAKVNPIVGQAGVQAGAGAVSANTQRVTLASDDPGVTSLQLLDDTVSTTGAATPAKGILVTGTDGTNARGIKTDASGELQIDVLTQPARAATTDSISSKDSTDVIQNGLVALTPKFKEIDAATSGDNTILAAVTSKKIRVVSLYLVASAAVNVRFESGASGTALSGQMNLAANGGFVLPYNPVGWFETASGVLLNLELSAAVSVDGGFTYIEV